LPFLCLKALLLNAVIFAALSFVVFVVSLPSGKKGGAIAEVESTVAAIVHHSDKAFVDASHRDHLLVMQVHVAC